jgi:Fur family ferric uptake transcriptional regulator
MADSKTILRNSKLSVTSSRADILALFLEAKGALSQSDLEQKLAPGFDRVTVYRTLHTFVEKGIVHQIPTTDNNVLYALCVDECSDSHHHDNHVHFVCNACQVTTCLPEVTVPKVSLPAGFKPQSKQMIVEGVCGKCEG